MKIKLSEIQIFIKTFGVIFTSVCSAVAVIFFAMNLYFAPRHVVQKEIGVVKEEVKEVKADVKWIRKVWEEGIKKAEVE